MTMLAKPRLKEKYEKVVVPQIMKDFALKNVMAAPRITKLVVNVGLKQGLKDPKFNDHVERVITKITGQKPVRTLAKKAISNFKIRQGQVVGTKVTLRGRRMYDFMDKLLTITLPRVRDFRGLSPKTVDRDGNLSIGFREFIAFPEIKPEDTDYAHGLEVTVVTTAKDRAKGLALLRGVGFPINEK